MQPWSSVLQKARYPHLEQSLQAYDEAKVLRRDRRYRKAYSAFREAQRKAAPHLRGDDFNRTTFLVSEEVR